MNISEANNTSSSSSLVISNPPDPSDYTNSALSLPAHKLPTNRPVGILWRTEDKCIQIRLKKMKRNTISLSRWKIINWLSLSLPKGRVADIGVSDLMTRQGGVIYTAWLRGSYLLPLTLFTFIYRIRMWDKLRLMPREWNVGVSECGCKYSCGAIII